MSFLAEIIIGSEVLRRKQSQLPATPTTTLVPTHFIKVPQEKYRCATDQGDWEEAAPIDFGGIKLTDAANKSYHGLHGHDDEVLDYNGVGSTILCRLTVRRTPQASQT